MCGNRKKSQGARLDSSSIQKITKISASANLPKPDWRGANLSKTLAKACKKNVNILLECLLSEV